MVVETRAVVYITEVGRAALEAEVACLRWLEQDITADQSGPVFSVKWETGARQAAAAELAAIQREIGRLERVLQGAIPLAPGDGLVGVGSRVRLREADGTSWTVGLVGPVAANPLLGLVSYESSLGKAILGRQVGDAVEVRDGSGVWRGRIVELDKLAR
ncbi:MAG: GreA/GreB family elongation factor [Chloroflexota bacterium]